MCAPYWPSFIQLSEYLCLHYYLWWNPLHVILLYLVIYFFPISSVPFLSIRNFLRKLISIPFVWPKFFVSCLCRNVSFLKYCRKHLKREFFFIDFIGWIVVGSTNSLDFFLNSFKSTIASLNQSVVIRKELKRRHSSKTLIFFKQIKHFTAIIPF